MNWSIVLFCLVVGLLPLYVFAKGQASPLMLAKPAEALSLFAHSEQYWLTEKYDGVRAYWDGQNLYTRQLNPIAAPTWFTDQFPAMPLDGELWIKRGKFDQVSAIVRKHKANDEEWQRVKYVVFDTPQPNKIYEQRQKELAVNIAKAKVSWLKHAKYLLIENKKQLETIYQQIINAGGEGIMLNLAQSNYRPGRTSRLLKLKPFEDDEAIVVDYIKGKGRLTGLVGSLIVKTRNGQLLRVGSGLDDEERRHPPEIGAIITFRYSGLTSLGTPRFPRFHRLRPDLDAL